jgi:hypothetical protein
MKKESKYKNIADFVEAWGDFKDARAGGNTKAHWVNPSGKVYDVKDTHIIFVSEKPSLFKTSVDKMKKLYDKYDEKFPNQEGKARIEILTDIVKSGWIRTRFRPREGAWVAETWKWGSREKKALRKWAKYETKGKKLQFRINLVSTSKNKIIGHTYSLDVIREQIVESSLSRIWRDFQENEFGIITSWRVGDKDNRKNLSMLKSAIRSGGYGYVRIDGVGQEEVDGKVVQANEPSLLVKNVKKGGGPLVDSKKFEKFMYGLGKKYKQWGIVLQHPDKGTRLIALKNEDGKSISPKVDAKMSKFSPMKTAQFFSKLKGKPFTFEGFKYADKPENWIHGMSLEKKGEVDIHKRESTEKWMKEIMNILEGE